MIYACYFFRINRLLSIGCRQLAFFDQFMISQPPKYLKFSVPLFYFVHNFVHHFNKISQLLVFYFCFSYFYSSLNVLFFVLLLVLSFHSLLLCVTVFHLSLYFATYCVPLCDLIVYIVSVVL